MFTLGIVLGVGVYAVAFQGGAWTRSSHGARSSAKSPVGVGNRLGTGCTSGHGGCGVGSVSRTALVSVVTFLAVAVVTAQLVAALGVQP